MIPYFSYRILSLGPLHIQVWGLFVALGIAAAAIVGHFEAGKRRLDAAVWLDLATWMTAAAIVGSRLFFALFYEPGSLLREPAALLRLWDGGLSIFGGFVGAAAAAFAFTRRWKLPFLAYADLAAFVLPLGCAIGRLGCFCIHDHPGVETGFFLAVRFPDGPRLDHGLLLALLNLLIFLFFLALRRRPGGLGRPYLALYMLIYGAARFGLDFLRAWDLPQSDPRILALTPAQYLSLLLAAAGSWLLFRKMRPAVSAPAA
jgi:phosphatidylglycerol:prolipoprotein diacylglycerol transferase